MSNWAFSAWHKHSAEEMVTCHRSASLTCLDRHKKCIINVHQQKLTCCWRFSKRNQKQISVWRRQYFLFTVPKNKSNDSARTVRRLMCIQAFGSRFLFGDQWKMTNGSQSCHDQCDTATRGHLTTEFGGRNVITILYMYVCVCVP